MDMFQNVIPRRTWAAYSLGIVLITGLLVVLLFTRGESVTGLAHSPENLLRLHVLAHSDAPEEQQVKLVVRDAILQEMSSWKAPESKEELERVLQARASELRDVARSTLADSGFDHEVKVEIGDFEFDERRSGDVVFPPGTYRAVRVVIGAGAGRNWWCVLFPPLCFVDDGAEVAVDQRAVDQGSEHYVGEGQSALNRLVFSRVDAEPNATGAANSQGDVGSDSDGPNVKWRLRLWETISRSSYGEALRELLLVSSHEER